MRAPRTDREAPALVARLIETIEYLGDAVAILRAPGDPASPATFVRCNAAFRRLYGYEPAALVGAAGDTIFGSRTDPDRIGWIRQRMVDGEEARAVVVLYTRDGSPLWTQLALVPLPAGGDGARYFVGTFRDVTARKQFEDGLAAEKRKLQTTLAAIADAVVTIRADGRIDELNEAARQLLAIDAAEAYGAHVDEVVKLLDDEAKRIDLRARALAADDDARRGQGHLRVEARTIDVAFVAARIDAEGNAVVVLRDVTAEHRLALKLSFEASHDPLTGLPNRRAFLERLETAVRSAREHRAHHAVAFLDLDRFKVVNDRFGHAAGDRVLRELAKVMGRVVRGGDVLARIGGDEFALLLSECRLDDARRVAEKMRKAVDAYRIEHGGEVLGVGVSIGLAPIEAETESAAQALAEADKACYKAKAAGRNLVAG